MCKLVWLWKWTLIKIIPSKSSPLLCLIKCHCSINSQRSQKAQIPLNHRNSSNWAWATSSAFYVRRALSVKRNMRDMARLPFTKLIGRDTLNKRGRNAKFVSDEHINAHFGTAVRRSQSWRQSLTPWNMVALTSKTLPRVRDNYWFKISWPTTVTSLRLFVCRRSVLKIADKARV